MIWTCKTFQELSVDELHDIIQLRINVFVVEQNCPYPELDGQDRLARHFFGRTEEGQIVAYTRFFGPGEYFEQPAIGRVVVHSSHRGNGTGQELMRETIKTMNKLYGLSDIKIGAQRYLLEFYKNLGFERTGLDYMEDGIPHVYMIRRAGLL